jgi:uncharacterized protein (TIGR02452 family)
MSFSIQPTNSFRSLPIAEQQKDLIRDMITAFEKGIDSKAEMIFESLPAEVQNAIYGKHWEICGRPTHPTDFGRVSFLDLDKGCKVPAEKKIATLNAYLSSLSGNNQAIQTQPPSDSEFEQLQLKIIELQAKLQEECQKGKQANSDLLDKDRKKIEETLFSATIDPKFSEGQRKEITTMFRAWMDSSERGVVIRLTNPTNQQSGKNQIVLSTSSDIRKTEANLSMRRNDYEEIPLTINSQPPLQINHPSFQISSASSLPLPQTASSIMTRLNRLSFLLRNNNEALALQEFNLLPPDIQRGIYASLWIVRGKPMAGNPIAHDNFGEVSFFNKEVRCASTLEQKACAVEFYKTKAAIHEMISLLGTKDFEGAKKVFATLPSQVQNEIFGKHWEVCGRPTSQSSDDSLRKMADDDFGKVSFLSLKPHCDVPIGKKIETLKAYLPDLGKKLDEAQDWTNQKINEWSSVDKNVRTGAQKNAAKKAVIDEIAKKIAPLFLGKDVRVDLPAPAINPATGLPKDSYQAWAEAYVEKYPCLKPFLLQLIPTLTFSNEKLEPLGEDLQAPKTSQAQNPNFRALSEKETRSYLISVMEETSATLSLLYYINSKKERITLHLEPAIGSIQCIQGDEGPRKPNGNYKTRLFLDKRDCLTVTRDCAERGLNPIVLDAASDTHFGGGYKTGARAQEEYLCRTSGLSSIVDPTLGRQKNNFYPISKNGEHAALYVAHVPVFRGEEAEGYPYLDQPFETAVAVVAAYNFNAEHQRKNGVANPLQLVKDPQSGQLRIPEPQAQEMKAKMRTVLHMAQLKGHESVVLLPLGCGAFCNPPTQVSQMMMELITQEFPNSFKEIHISVLDDHNTGKAHNPRGNFIEFKEAIERIFIPQMKIIGATFQEI